MTTSAESAERLSRLGLPSSISHSWRIPMSKESVGGDITGCIAQRQKMEWNDNFTWTKENITGDMGKGETIISPPLES